MGSFVAEALYALVDMLYEKLVDFVNTFWDNTFATFNHGQMTIYGNYMDPAIQQWLDDAGVEWPYADPDYYAADCYACYDMQVTERAFSDSIETPLSDMWDIIFQAQVLYELAQAIEAAVWLA